MVWLANPYFDKQRHYYECCLSCFNRYSLSIRKISSSFQRGFRVLIRYESDVTMVTESSDFLVAIQSRIKYNSNYLQL
jgi:hypothetical protein